MNPLKPNCDVVNVTATFISTEGECLHPREIQQETTIVLVALSLSV